ncbi:MULTISPECIES: hypothetical protein [Enterococcus]|uniref:CvpA family protein n=1 Tax=Enterococcus alishanensis TaxID=1303817 RepID=A0ABS6TD90_9ENTE|nr:hypothetical protein [Enterococcus alishanensis]MBV7390878.1 hypothetical protein [Enterococcus alishanensis]
MEQILALVVLAFIIYLVVRLSSVIWRVLGVLLIIFLIYAYKDQAFAQMESFVANPDFGGLLGTISQFFTSLWGMISNLFHTIIN